MRPAAGQPCGQGGLIEDVGLLDRIGGDRQCLLEEARGLLLARPGMAARAAAALSAMRAWPASASASCAFPGVRVRGEVMTGESAGDLVAAECLEVACRGEVQFLAVVL